MVVKVETYGRAGRRGRETLAERERLASYYDLSDPEQQMQFVMDYGLVFAGIPSSNGFISGAWESRGGPAVTYGYSEKNKPIQSYLHYGNEGLPEDFLDDENDAYNQTHHYAESFFFSYFFGFGPANIINIWRDYDNFGDLLLGWEAADDAALFSISPEDLIVLLTEW